MSIDEFYKVIKELGKLNDINYSEEECLNLYKYMNLLLEWNKKINLTAITEPNEIILKHFIDSSIINKYIEKNANLIDVGTGAGLPGIVLKIMNKDINVTLLDALNKRIIFLNNVINQIELDGIRALHERAEALGNISNYRENFDIVVSRAVANMNILLEYMMPFVKVGGICICMKSVNVNQELENAKNVINLLGGVLEKVDKYYLRDEKNNILEREIVVIRKKFLTLKEYPRTSNKINKKPLF